MPLTPEGKELLELAKENILANAEFYDQNDFAYETEDKCGTVCCVAGWVDFLHHGRKKHLERMYQGVDMWTDSAQLLGLTEEESSEVFENSVHHPDKEFQEEYEDATTDGLRAQAAGRMIDRFIASHS